MITIKKTGLRFPEAFLFCIKIVVRVLLVLKEGQYMSIDNKILLSTGGIILVMPAKPIIALATIGTVAVLSAGYYLIKNGFND